MQASVRPFLYAFFVVLFGCRGVSGFGVPAASNSIEAMHTAATHLSQMIPHNIDLLATYKCALSSHPLPTKMLTGATLAVCGDAIAQSRDPSTEYDRRRAASFAAFDMPYRALQHFLFPIIVGALHGQYLGSWDANHILDSSQWAAMEQTLASQLGIVPFLYYPAFFALTGAVQGLTMSGAAARAKENFFPLMKRNLLFWIPVQFIQFGYVQEDLQIPFLSVCGLAWTFLLSVAAGSTKNYTPQREIEDASVMQSFQQDESIDSSSNEELFLPRMSANATSY